MRLKLSYGVGLAGLVAVITAGLLGGRASADAPPVINVEFLTQHGHPVAGKSFAGLAITNDSGIKGKATPFTSVRCDAQIGAKRLHARTTVFGAVRPGSTQTTVCSWNIPAGAAGKHLRLWHYLKSSDGNRAVVYYGRGTVGSPEFSWTVKKR